MNNMAKQMELFEPVERGFEEGGLMEEGGIIDEESGNEVPPGSLREEVRDDIPAQLSEGEFVFPADVVRYIGLKNLMRMRQEAKQGLAQMEAMGQMGNSDEAVVEDNLPFNMYDLDVEDEEEYNSETRNYQVGGYVAPNIPYNQPNQINPQTGVYQLPGTGIAGYYTPGGTYTGYTPYGGAQPYFQPVQFTGPQYQTALQTTNLPTFAETVGNKPGQYDELRTYVNDAGQTLQIPFKNGQPIYPIPEGYRPKGDQPAAEQPTTTPVTTTSVTEQGDGGRDGDDLVSTSTSMASLFGSKDDKPTTLGIENIYDTAAKTNDYFGGSKAFGWNNEELRAATFDQGFAQLGTIGLAGMVSDIAKQLRISDFSLKDVGQAGFDGMNAALNSMGLINRGQLMNNEQATLVGNAMASAHAAAYKGEDVTAAYNKVMNTPEARATIDKTLTDIRDSYARVSNNAKGISFAEAAEVARADAVTFKSQVNDLANPVNGSARIVDGSGNPVNTVVDPRTGQRVQDPTKSRAFHGQGKKDVDAAEAKQKQAETIAKAFEDKAKRDKEREDKAAAEKASRDRLAQIQQQQYSDSGGDNADSYGGSGVESGGRGEGFGDFSSGLSHAKGGLVSQMKRSGLASKK
jgi:hypothetical protein